MNYIKSFQNNQIHNYENKFDIYLNAIKEDNKLREIFKKDPNNPILKDPYLNLINIYENYDIFKSVGLSKQETNQVILFKKNIILPKINTMQITDSTQFKINFDIFTNKIFEKLNWNNLFLAGGSINCVLNNLPDNIKTEQKIKEYYETYYKESDLDLSIWGLNAEKATKKLFEIYNCLPKECSFIKTTKTITIIPKYPFRKIQIYLRIFKSPAEILLDFDVDSCTFGYDGNNVYCAPRGHYALITKRNVLDVSRISEKYFSRLHKYNLRGYGIVVPYFQNPQSQL